MSCASTLTAYRPTNGGPVHFSPPKNGHAYTKIELPCGQCILCRLEHARQWAVRITHEAQLHEQNSFITLTYDDEHLPQYNSLSSENADEPKWQREHDRNHLSKFWKRLRKEVGKLRYYAVGEYGDETQRPHYHACIFGNAFLHQRRILRTSPTMLWTHPTLEKAWGMGNVSVGALTFQTAQYTAAYVTKKLNNARRYVRIDEETGELIPLVQPRAYMSLRPAIGSEWLDQFGKQTYDHDRVVIDGRPQKPPKYYDKWLAAKSEEQIEIIKQKRKKKATKLTEEESHARAQNAHAHAENRKRRL